MKRISGLKYFSFSQIMASDYTIRGNFKTQLTRFEWGTDNRTIMSVKNLSGPTGVSQAPHKS